MQREEQQSSLSLPQRAYVISDSLNEGAKLIGAILAVLTLYILLGLYFFFIEADRESLVILIALFYVLFTPFIIWWLIKMHSFNKHLEEWKDDYINDMYSLIFNITVPKGNTTGERILSLASMVFPQMRKDYIKFSIDPLDHVKYYFTKFRKSKEHIISKSLNYKATPDYDLDVAFETLGGYLIVKEFRDKVVTIDDLRYLIGILTSNFKGKFRRGTNILTVICVAKEYDESFLNRESLERIMTEVLEPDFEIDLIVEEDIGYNVLWVS